MICSCWYYGLAQGTCVSALWVRVPMMVMNLSGFLSFCMCYRAFTILWALACEKMPPLFLCSWRMDLALNSNRACFPGLWISTYCSHEILWVLKIMDWLSRTEILVVFICEVSKTHIIVYCYSDSLILLTGGYNCLYVYSRVCVCVCVCVLVTQSYLTLWRPMDCNPWNSLGKDTGVDCHALLQGIFPTRRSNSGLLHCRQILYCLSHWEILYNTNICSIHWIVLLSIFLLIILLSL